MIENYQVSCPYCGECFSTVVDLSTLDMNPSGQDYIEDCQICCRPIRFIVRNDIYTNQPTIELRRDDD